MVHSGLVQMVDGLKMACNDFPKTEYFKVSGYLDEFLPLYNELNN